MSKRDLEYDEFYSDIYFDKYPINVLSDKDQFLKFRNNMKCPECLTANLHYTHCSSNRKAFLSSNNVQEHREGCSHRFKVASKAIIKEFLKKLTEEKLQDKLNAALNLLLVKDNRKKVAKFPAPGENPLVIETKRSGVRKYYSLPRKTIRHNMDLDENLCLYYGHVKLQIEDKSSSKYSIYLLHFLVKEDNMWKRVCKIHLKEKIQISEDCEYDVALIGSKSETYYNQIDLVNGWNSFKIRVSKQGIE